MVLGVGGSPFRAFSFVLKISYLRSLNVLQFDFELITRSQVSYKILFGSNKAKISPRLNNKIFKIAFELRSHNWHPSTYFACFITSSQKISLSKVEQFFPPFCWYVSAFIFYSKFDPSSWIPSSQNLWWYAKL